MTRVKVEVRLSGDLEGWPRKRWAVIIRDYVEDLVALMKEDGADLNVDVVVVQHED